MKITLLNLCLNFVLFKQNTALLKDCVFESMDTSLKSCMKFLGSLKETDFPNCQDDKEVCKIEGSPSCASSCAEIQAQGNKMSGIYTICFKPWFRMPPLQVFCDLETRGGGWTVIQRRGNYKEPIDFFRNWTDYKLGFGNLSTQFWLGNDYIFALTNQDHVALRVELQDFENNERWAEYNDFRIRNEDSSYQLSHLGNYTGDAGDSMTFHKGMAFFTHDKDNWMKCARDRRGGWWYYNCHRANLNGLYLSSKQQLSESVERLVSWGSFHGYDYSLKHTEMKIRPAFF